MLRTIRYENAPSESNFLMLYSYLDLPSKPAGKKLFRKQKHQLKQKRSGEEYHNKHSVEIAQKVVVNFNVLTAVQRNVYETNVHNVIFSKWPGRDT